MIPQLGIVRMLLHIGFTCQYDRKSNTVIAAHRGPLQPDFPSMPNLQPFHLAFPVQDLQVTRDFYTRILGCRIGRSSDNWIDFDLFGHQIVAHLAPNQPRIAAHSHVDGKEVPVPHFGVILGMAEWEALAQRLRAVDTKFVIEPYVRFKGQVGEQATMFFLDPSGNALEFKAFADLGQIFAR